MDSARDDEELPSPGFPIRTSPDQRLVDGSPRLFAATRVLHRLSTPRHPPHALSSLVDPILSPPRGDDRSGPRSRPYKWSGTMLNVILISIERMHSVEIEVPSFLRMRLSKSSGRPCGRPLLVEPIGIEPTTSCLQSRRSPN